MPEGRFAEVTRAALRGLLLDTEEQERRLSKAPAEVADALRSEMGQIQWVTAILLMWQEAGVLDEVMAFALDSDALEKAA